MLTSRLLRRRPMPPWPPPPLLFPLLLFTTHTHTQYLPKQNALIIVITHVIRMRSRGTLRGTPVNRDINRTRCAFLYSQGTRLSILSYRRAEGKRKVCPSCVREIRDLPYFATFESG